MVVVGTEGGCTGVIGTTGTTGFTGGFVGVTFSLPQPLSSDTTNNPIKLATITLTKTPIPLSDTCIYLISFISFPPFIRLTFIIKKLSTTLVYLTLRFSFPLFLLIISNYKF